MTQQEKNVLNQIVQLIQNLTVKADGLLISMGKHSSLFAP